MNTEMTIQNMKAQGNYKADRVVAFVKEKSTSIEPSVAQVNYRNDLYKFLVEKGVVRDGFKLGRTKQTIHRDIRGLWTLIRKHGLTDEWNRRGGEADE